MNGSGKGVRSAESAAALRQLFAWIGKRYGGLPMDTGCHAEVIIRQRRLLSCDLQRLMTHQATALQVKGYFDPFTSATLAFSSPTLAFSWTTLLFPSTTLTFSSTTLTFTLATLTFSSTLLTF